jgi:hypothetical protein
MQSVSRTIAPSAVHIPALQGQVVETVKAKVLLNNPPCITCAVPDFDPGDTVAMTWVSAQLTTTPGLVPSHTKPGVDPKPVPVTVICAPTPPELGATLVIAGDVPAGRTVKVTPLLATPETVTTTAPVVAPPGTGATMLVAFQIAGVASVPLKATVLDPCVVPKFVPAIVTKVSVGPETGERLAMCGVGSTVKAIPLLATPDIVTSTLPVVAPAGTVVWICVLFQLVTIASVPLNVTVLLAG